MEGERRSFYVGVFFFMRRYCHGFGFSPVMQRTRFFENAVLIYVESEKAVFNERCITFSAATTATDSCGTCGTKNQNRGRGIFPLLETTETLETV